MLNFTFFKKDRLSMMVFFLAFFISLVYRYPCILYSFLYVLRHRLRHGYSHIDH